MSSPKENRKNQDGRKLPPLTDEQKRLWQSVRGRDEMRDAETATNRALFARSLVSKLVVQEAEGDEGWIRKIAGHLHLRRPS